MDLNIGEVNAEPDPITVPGQKYALISIVSPESNQKSKHLAMKLSGVFPDEESAKTHAQKMMKINPAFDIYVLEMYNWVCLPPDNDNLPSEYGDERLNDLMKGYKEQRENAQMELMKRRNEVMAHPSEEKKSESEGEGKGDTELTPDTPSDVVSTSVQEPESEPAPTPSELLESMN